eukprot:m.197840 g.197840  ORF g.197840 m.197840 type:complete len:789 (+) comp17029_c0_seq2:70-2436(+)
MTARQPSRFSLPHLDVPQRKHGDQWSVSSASSYGSEKVQGTAIAESMWADILQYSDVICEHPDPWLMTGRLLLFGCHSGRHWPLVPRLQNITGDIHHPFREPSVNGLDAILPYCVSVLEDDNNQKRIYVEPGVLEGLLGPLLLQSMLVANILGMLYLPVVLICIVAVVFTELDLECALGRLPIITILAIKGVLHLMILCIRVTIHIQTQHWKAQVKNERHSMLDSLKKERREFERVKRKLPHALQMDADYDTVLADLDESRRSSRVVAPPMQAKPKLATRGIWLHKLVLQRHKIDALFYSSLRALACLDQIQSGFAYLLLKVLTPINLAWDIVAIVFLVELRNSPCNSDSIYGLLWVLCIVALITSVQRALTIVFWLLELGCRPGAVRKWVTKQLKLIDDRDYSGVPVTSFIYTALFDIHRPSRTRTIIEQLQEKLDADQGNESIKRELYTQELLDRALFQVSENESFESGAETEEDTSSAFHATRLASRPTKPAVQRHMARHTTGPKHQHRERLMMELHAVSGRLLEKFGEEYDEIIDKMNDLIDDHHPMQALALRPKAFRITRDLLTQLEMQRSLLIHQLDNPHLTEQERRRLTEKNLAVIDREQEVDDLMEELQTLNPFQTHSDGSNSPRPPPDDALAISISIEDADARKPTRRTDSRKSFRRYRQHSSSEGSRPLSGDGLDGPTTANQHVSSSRPTKPEALLRQRSPRLTRVDALGSTSSSYEQRSVFSPTRPQAGVRNLTTATGLQPHHLESATLSMVVAKRSKSHQSDTFRPGRQYPNTAVV